MRVLFTTYSDTSHLLGMVPLVWALRTAGHEVRVASQPRLTDVIASTGLTAVPVGTDHRFFEIMAAGGDQEPAEEEFDLTEDRPEKLTWAAPGRLSLVEDAHHRARGRHAVADGAQHLANSTDD